MSRVVALVRSHSAVVSVDHAVASLSNAVATVAIARSLPADDLGAFSLVFAGYWLVLGSCRAYVQEPMLLRYRAMSPDDRRTYVHRAFGTTLGIGSTLAVLGVVVALALPELAIRDALLPAAVALPLLLVQDLLRYVDFARGRHWLAMVSDVIWLVLICALMFQADSLLAATAAWAASGAVAALLMPGALLRGLKSLNYVRWLREHSGSGGFLLMEFTSLQVVGQAMLWLVAGLLGLAQAGIFRAGQVLLAPTRLITAALTVALLPDMTVAGADRVLVQARRYALVSTGIAVVYALLLLACPTRVGEFVLGDVWAETRDVALIMALGTVALALVQSCLLVLKALHEFRATAVIRLSIVPASLLFGAVGALVWGVAGAAWGLVLVEAGSLILWVRAARTALQTRARTVG